MTESTFSRFSLRFWVSWPDSFAKVQTVTFDFDSGTPTLSRGQSTPFEQRSGGITAQFSSPTGAAFSIQNDVEHRLEAVSVFRQLPVRQQPQQERPGDQVQPTAGEQFQPDIRYCRFPPKSRLLRPIQLMAYLDTNGNAGRGLGDRARNLRDRTPCRWARCHSTQADGSVQPGRNRRHRFKRLGAHRTSWWTTLKSRRHRFCMSHRAVSAASYDERSASGSGIDCQRRSDKDWHRVRKQSTLAAAADRRWPNASAHS